MRKRIAAGLLMLAIIYLSYIGFTTGSVHAAAGTAPLLLNVNEAFTFSMGDEPTAYSVEWNLKRGGSDVMLTDYIEGTLDAGGGNVKFTQTGTYELTASVADITGRVFKSSRTVVVDNPLNCNFTIPTSSQHVSKSFTVTMDTAASFGGKTISWSLTKDGVNAAFVGNLDNSGGSINVSSKGTYTLTATVADDMGVETACTKTFEAFNNAPAMPVINRTPSSPIVGNSTYVTINATADDPDGDTVSLVWENRSSEPKRYTPGAVTVRCKAVDSWGEESEWAESKFESKLDTINEYITIVSYITTTKTVTIDASAVSANYAVIVPQVSGYSGADTVYFYGFYEPMNSWELIRSANCKNGVNISGSLDISKYKKVYASYKANNSGIHDKAGLWLNITINFY